MRITKKSTKTKTAQKAGVPSDAAAYLKSLEDPEIVERVLCKINEGHVFKLPPRQTSGGWRGADWTNEVWQGVVKVVDRASVTVVLLLDKQTESIFAVCPLKDGAVDRCVDSSRYFVLRVENADGRHMFVGIAFNERNDAFDFNVALDDARRERELEKNPIQLTTNTLPHKDYSLKDGETIKVTVSKRGAGDINASSVAIISANKKDSNSRRNVSLRALKPSKNDSPSHPQNLIRKRVSERRAQSKISFPTTFDNHTFGSTTGVTDDSVSNNNGNTERDPASTLIDYSYNKFWSLFGEDQTITAA